MPAASSLSVNDSTPTAHVYVPRQVSPNLSIFRNTADAAVAATEEQIGLSFSPASSSRETNKVKISLAVPHEQTVDGAVVVRDTFRFNGEFVIPDGMSSTERAHAAALVANMLDNADISGYITDLEPVW